MTTTGEFMGHGLKVLVLADYYPPGSKAGGPIRSISRLCVGEADRHHVTVVTRDRDLGEHSPYPEETRAAAVADSRVDVKYCTSTYLHLLATLWRIARSNSIDILYLNSIFSPKFSLWPLLLLRLGVVHTERVLLAPRGELAESALKLKATKKRLASALLRALGLPRNVIWHATSAHEVADIERFMKSRRVDVVERPSIGPAPAADLSLPPDRGVLRLVQVGRIVPIKNLLVTLRALALLRAPVALRIVGLTEDLAYWQQCETIIRSLPSNVTVSRDGHLTPEDVRLALEDSDAMILPTRGENFGHAIAESLAVGCPVLIPPTTMWTEIVQHGAGRLIDVADPALIAKVVETQSRMSWEERAGQRRAALRLYSDWWAECDRAQQSIFGLVGQRSQPR